jgi:hypothetical protein
MTFLNDPRCPRCQAPVPLGSLWKRAAKDRGAIFLVGRIGICCPSCGARLRVLQAGLITGALASFVVLCAAFGALGSMEHAKLGAAKANLNLLLIAPGIVGWLILFRRYGYQFASVRPVEDGETVSFPLSKPVVEEPMDGERPDRQTSARRQSQVALEPAGHADPERPAWICPECKEENPGQFDRCCICDTERDATAQQ